MIVSENKTNEAGFMDLIFVMVMAAVMTGMLAQIIFNQRSLHQIHSSNRERVLINHKLKSLALKFKEARVQAEVGVCTGSNSILTKNGGDFCLPTGNNLCINMTEVIGGTQVIRQVCTSIRDADLAWNDARVSTATLQDIDTPIGSGVRNRITVPALTDELWKSCATDVCLRIVLCEDGDTNCSLADAAAYQIVQF